MYATEQATHGELHAVLLYGAIVVASIIWGFVFWLNRTERRNKARDLAVRSKSGSGAPKSRNPPDRKGHRKSRRHRSK